MRDSVVVVDIMAQPVSADALIGSWLPTRAPVWCQNVTEESSFSSTLLHKSPELTPVNAPGFLSSKAVITDGNNGLAAPLILCNSLQRCVPIDLNGAHARICSSQLIYVCG